MGHISNRRLAGAITYTEATPDRLRALRVPTLALQGSADRNIDPSTLRRIGALMSHGDVELHYVRGVRHSLVDVMRTPIVATLAEDIKTRIAAFLSSVSHDR